MSVNHGLLFAIFRCFAPADDSLSLDQVWLDSNQVASVHQLQKLCDSRKANLLVFGLQEPWSTSSWSRLLQAKEAMDWCPLLSCGLTTKLDQTAETEDMEQIFYFRLLSLLYELRKVIMPLVVECMYFAAASLLRKWFNKRLKLVKRPRACKCKK